ncbi:MAG: SprB repeat-containing protein [Saccharofermentanales bacterium]
MLLEKTDVMCFGGSDGKITITATGENGEYQYKLNDGNYQDNNIFNGLTKGQYTVWVKSSNGVSINDNIDITEPTILSFTYNVTHPTTTEQNGTITIDANGGTSPYKYRLNNDQFKDNNTLNVKDGTHSITVMDNNECTKIESDIVVNKFIPEQPIVNIKAATNATGTTVTLNGEVNPNGGTTSLYFEYGLSTSYGNTINISNKTGNTTVGVSTNLTGLNSQSTYNYRLVAINEGGTTYSDNITFETGYKVGDELHGGTIFKVDGFYPDQTGLIAWNEDENNKGWSDFFYKQYGDYSHNTFGT